MRMTLNNAWRECLAMYKWVAGCWLLTGDPVSSLKRRWLKAHGYKQDELSGDCFFCEYDVRHRGEGCKNCPAVLVDEDFKCVTPTHRWCTKPVEFYLKMGRLNKIRLAK